MSIKDIYKEAEKDRKDVGYVYQFEKEIIKGVKAYIKIKPKMSKTKKMIVVISFHE